MNEHDRRLDTGNLDPATPQSVRSHDLVIIGTTAGAISVAESARQAGVNNVLIIERGSSMLFPEVVARNGLAIDFGVTILSIDIEPETELVLVRTTEALHRASACVIAERPLLPHAEFPVTVAPSDRVCVDAPSDSVAGSDVMVVGLSDHAVEATIRLVHEGANVVLAGGGMEPARLSHVAGEMLAELERERRATVLYRSSPSSVGMRDGYPLVYFNDRRTPDLEFDYVVFAGERSTADLVDLGVTTAAKKSKAVWLFASPDQKGEMARADGPELWPSVASARFPEAGIVEYGVRSWSRDTTMSTELAGHYYNATITGFEPTHSDLWRLRVRPDHGDTSHLPGQYATLGLGYWEPRVDDAVDPDIDEKWLKLIRRSYSISSPILDSNGYLADPTASDELEFYVVLVLPTADNVPALTPRLALKRPGDRLFLGSKVAGRYTLGPVVDPTRAVVFLGTGTGEAPHNAMVAQLLRKGHRGPIVSAVTVRHWNDLGYRGEHLDLASRYPNYHYLPLPTREPDSPKLYLQDVIRSDGFEKRFGVSLDPESTDVFLCGNPAMIGLPQGTYPDELTWPEPTGVVELLVRRGFVLDRRGTTGNIHFEEYW